MTLEDLVLEYQKTDKGFEQILERMKPGLKAWTRNEDEKQIASIALWKCAKSWDPAAGCGFSLFAMISIKRRVAIQRKKQQHLELTEEIAEDSQLDSYVLVNQINETLTEPERKFLAGDTGGVTRQAASKKRRALLASLQRWALGGRENRHRKSSRSFRTPASKP